MWGFLRPARQPVRCKRFDRGWGQRCALTLPSGFVIQLNCFDTPGAAWGSVQTRPRPNGNPQEQDGSERVCPKRKLFGAREQNQQWVSWWPHEESAIRRGSLFGLLGRDLVRGLRWRRRQHTDDFDRDFDAERFADDG